ncbi:MAG: hypothetical protein KGO22_17885, partial [Gammaproteobacteria bacterium]|nr:hypothetical protein [Gammaproteobacteria bacterium]
MAAVQQKKSYDALVTIRAYQHVVIEVSKADAAALNSLSCAERLAERSEESYRRPPRVWRSVVATPILFRHQNYAR